jgi:D-serine deaminase-like pyridoxal phosphate-dependent protein
MPTMPPAEIGAPVSEIDTPALIVDLDALTRNLEKMAALVKRLGVRLRPHAKTHKSSVIAARQIALGVCCQKVSEAEALVAGGVVGTGPGADRRGKYLILLIAVGFRDCAHSQQGEGFSLLELDENG